jgi:hypothetical protein
MTARRLRSVEVTGCAFAGFRFPPDIIVLAVRWYLRFGLTPDHVATSPCRELIRCNSAASLDW